MNRRQLLKLIGLGVIGHAIDFDVDRLLWVPGERTIFIPDSHLPLTISQIVAIELEHIVPKLQSLFERDAIFFKYLKDE